MYRWDMENKDTYNNKMGRYKTSREFDFITQFIDKTTDILDVGGGSGRFAIPLHQNCQNITVIDKDSEAIAILNKRCPTIKCINADFLNMEFGKAKKFDLILAIEVLLYISDWSSFFAKVHGLLKDNGLFVFTATNKNSWRTISRKLSVRLMRRADYEYTILSAKDYSKIIRSSSFKIERSSGFLWSPCKLDSNSMFVDIFSSIENYLYLGSFIQQSPWLLYAIRKT